MAQGRVSAADASAFRRSHRRTADPENGLYNISLGTLPKLHSGFASIRSFAGRSAGRCSIRRGIGNGSPRAVFAARVQGEFHLLSALGAQLLRLPIRAPSPCSTRRITRPSTATASSCCRAAGSTSSANCRRTDGGCSWARRIPTCRTRRFRTADGLSRWNLDKDPAAVARPAARKPRAAAGDSAGKDGGRILRRRHRKLVDRARGRNARACARCAIAASSSTSRTSRLSLPEFYQRAARAWLVWSPEGLGWDCFRHYEAPACGSVPVINQPNIERHQPLVHGEHAFYYDRSPGELTRTILCRARRQGPPARDGARGPVARHGASHAGRAGALTLLKRRCGGRRRLGSELMSRCWLYGTTESEATMTKNASTRRPARAAPICCAAIQPPPFRSSRRCRNRGADAVAVFRLRRRAASTRRWCFPASIRAPRRACARACCGAA